MDGIAALASTPGNELFERLNSLENENKRLLSGQFYNQFVLGLLNLKELKKNPFIWDRWGGNFKSGRILS